MKMWHAGVSILYILLLFSIDLLRAGEVHVQVLNGLNGKPITNECLNLWLDQWHGGSLVVPTNHEGVIVLYFGNREVRVEPVPKRTCNGTAVVEPRSVPTEADKIFVAGNVYVVCQEYRKVIPGEPAANSLPGK
jgi:hypothetical protein